MLFLQEIVFLEKLKYFCLPTYNIHHNQVARVLVLDQILFEG